MIQQGIINSSMTEEEMHLALTQMTNNQQKEQHKDKGEAENVNGSEQQPGCSKQVKGSIASSSEVTIYKRAVQCLNPKLDQELEKLLGSVRQDTVNQGRKVSYSSDEMLDTSDEDQDAHKIMNFSIADEHTAQAKDQRRHDVNKQPEELAEQLIREAEKAKTRMFEVPGEHNLIPIRQSVSSIDEDYQMIDAHVDELVKRKITNFEYIDLSKLLVKGRSVKEEEHQRLEIVNRNGMSYLLPVADRESVQINSYGKWEQAFRIYSNIVTAKHPGKATELLQYNHTIHAASTSYIWENVYSYDKEFRHHIGRHPQRPWNVILQQAWTMLLKDRVWNENSYFHKGKMQGKNKHDREPCRRYNRGRCSFGLSCHYDHRCSVKECGKFGHGAHVCRLKKKAEESNQTNSTTNGELGASK